MTKLKDILTEKNWIKTDPAERGKYKGKNITDLEKMKSALEKRNAKHKGDVPQADIEKMAELNFAIRAKQKNL